MKTTVPATSDRLPKYVCRKPHARHLWFRFAVPTKYRHLERSKLIQRDLLTTNKREAGLRADRMRLEYFDRWQGRLGADEPRLGIRTELIEPTIIDLQIAAFEGAYVHVRSKLDALLASKNLSDVSHYRAHIASLQTHLLRLIQTRQGDAKRHWQKVAMRQIQAKGWRLEAGSGQHERFIGMIADASIEALRVEIEQRSGGDPTPKHPIVMEGAKAKAERCIPGEGVLELFEQYGAQRLREGRKRLDTVNQDRKVVELFSTFVGPDRSLKSVTAGEVREWRDAVASLPASYRKRRGNEGLGLREASAKAKREGCQGLSA